MILASRHRDEIEHWSCVSQVMPVTVMQPVWSTALSLSTGWMTSCLPTVPGCRRTRMRVSRQSANSREIEFSASVGWYLRVFLTASASGEHWPKQVLATQTILPILADRTVAQYDRLLAMQCMIPSPLGLSPVRLSVCLCVLWLNNT